MNHKNARALRISGFFWGCLLAGMFSANAAAQNEAKADALRDAIRKDDARAVRAALSAGASPDARDEDGLTALMDAAAYAGLDCVGILLRKGADPNAMSNGGVTALMLAVDD